MTLSRPQPFTYRTFSECIINCRTEYSKYDICSDNDIDGKCSEQIKKLSQVIEGVYNWQTYLCDNFQTLLYNNIDDDVDWQFIKKTYRPCLLFVRNNNKPLPSTINYANCLLSCDFYTEHLNDMAKDYINSEDVAQINVYQLRIESVKEIKQIKEIPLNCEKELYYFIHSQVLKQNIAQKIFPSFIALQFRVQKFIFYSFYFVLIVKYPFILTGVDTETLKFRKKLCKNYVKLFSEIIIRPKEEMALIIMFTISYIVHYLFYKFFSNRQNQDMRFVLDVYHILIFELNGMYVSDYYIKNMTDRYFIQSKFMEYEKIRKQNQQKQQQFSKSKPNTFIGIPQVFPDISKANDGDGLKFSQMITEKFKGFRKLKQNVQQLMQKHQLKQQQLQQQLQFKQSQLLVEEYEKSHQMQQQTLHTQTSKQQDNQKQILKTSSEGMLINKNQHARNSSWNMSNLQLNCYQLSPAMTQMLSYEDMSLPHQKKIMRYTFEKPKAKIENLLVIMKSFNSSINKKKDLKQIKQIQKNFADLYNLKPPNKEYYEKHQIQKVDKMFREMLDLNYVLKYHQQGTMQLPSSIQIKENQIGKNPIGNMEQDLKKAEDQIMLQQLCEKTFDSIKQFETLIKNNKIINQSKLNKPKKKSNNKQNSLLHQNN